MQFSVVIPLESHRGLAERCIRAWTSGQTYSRGNYEVVVAAPDHYPDHDLQAIRDLLGPHDRLFTTPHHHDIPLVAEAARQSTGDVIVFTESHCLPDHDFLTQAALVFSEHPEWSGFSTRSIPLTHNLLSEIEAEMYVADIARNLSSHEWLKVLDQCFVVRRDAYERSGGLEPEYGHFAEWLLAGRFYRCGARIGYDPRPAVHHYYVGELDELEEFTADFAAGQMLFQQRADVDPCGDLFDEIAMWSDRSRWNPDRVAQLTGMLRRDLMQTLTRALHERSWSEFAGWPWREALGWGLRRVNRLGTKVRLVKLRRAWHRLQVRWRLLRGRRGSAQPAFLQLMSDNVDLGWMQALGEWIDDPIADATASANRVSEWRAGRFEALPTIGLHNLENCGRVPFRWSGQVAGVWLPPLTGDWTMRLEWAGCAPVATQTSARFYLDGRRIADDCVSHYPGHTLVEVRGTGQSACVGWVCQRTAAANDDRPLGLPLARLSWNSSPAVILPFRPRPAVPETERPIYFLHVQKCAGTTTRFLLSDSYSDQRLLAPHAEFYHAREFTEERRKIPSQVDWATGHLGWELPAAAPDRNWRVVTVVREPLDRLVSLWSYVRQHRRVERQGTFHDWLNRDILVGEALLSNFVPGMLERSEQGAASIAHVLDQHLNAALENLAGCEIVGLQEHMDDTVNLLCAATGSLPPRQTPHINVTLDRCRTDDVGEEAQRLFQRCLASDRAFYAEACSMFRKQRAALEQRLSSAVGQQLDSAAIRDVLRREWFDRMSQSVSDDDHLVWTAAAPFYGQNLQNREHHGGLSLRWSGPADDTWLYFPLAPGVRTEIALRLHPASPPAHVAAARLQINGLDVPLECESTAAGYLLTGEFSAPPPADELGRYSEFRLTVPTVQGRGEFRRLGVALLGIELQRVAQSIRFPVQAAVQRRVA